MKVRQEHIILVVALTLIIGLGGGVYQFYYKEKKAEYEKNVAYLESLETALKNIEDKFSGYKPELVISAYNAEVQPLTDQVLRQAAFFTMGDMLQVDPMPEGKIPKYYYEEQYNKIMGELRKDALARTPYIPYPDTATFGAKKPEEFANKNIGEGQITANLANLKFGCAMVRMLMDAKAVAITQVEIWPRMPGLKGLANFRTTGLAFIMYYQDLVAFLEQLRMKDRYFAVNAISIQNPYLRWPTAPPVQVKMLLTQANYNAEAVNQPGPPVDIGGFGGPAGGGGGAKDALQNANVQRPGEKEPTRWDKIRTWLKNHYLWL